jgi:hypothetical protein
VKIISIPLTEWLEDIGIYGCRKKSNSLKEMWRGLYHKTAFAEICTFSGGKKSPYSRNSYATSTEFIIGLQSEE